MTRTSSARRRRWPASPAIDAPSAPTGLPIGVPTVGAVEDLIDEVPAVLHADKETSEAARRRSDRVEEITGKDGKKAQLDNAKTANRCSPGRSILGRSVCAARGRNCA